MEDSRKLSTYKIVTNVVNYTHSGGEVLERVNDDCNKISNDECLNIKTEICFPSIEDLEVVIKKEEIEQEENEEDESVYDDVSTGVREGQLNQIKLEDVLCEQSERLIYSAYAYASKTKGADKAVLEVANILQLAETQITEVLRRKIAWTRQKNLRQTRSCTVFQNELADSSTSEQLPSVSIPNHIWLQEKKTQIGTLPEQSQHLVCNAYQYAMQITGKKGQISETAKILNLTRQTVSKIVKRGPVTPKKPINSRKLFGKIDSRSWDNICTEVKKCSAQTKNLTLNGLLRHLQLVCRFPYKKTMLRKLLPHLGLRFTPGNNRNIEEAGNERLLSSYQELENQKTPEIQNGLNRMHIMDDDCNRSTAVEEPPRNNGSLKSRRKSASADGEKDSDSGKENGPTCDKKEKEPPAVKETPQERSPAKEKTENEAEHAEKECKENAEVKSGVSESSAKTPEVVPVELNKKEEIDQEEGHSANDEEENASEGIIECNVSEEPDDPKMEMEEHKIEDVSRPLTPAEEDDVSPTSSPSHHNVSTNQPVEESRKRESSDSDQDTPIVKKMKMTPSELAERDRMVSDYVDNASGTSLDEIQRSSEKLQQEISTLNTLARAKEQEWNNIIRMKKIKEEALLRLQRKKDIMLIMMSSPSKGDMNFWDLPYDLRTGANILDDSASSRGKFESSITVPKSHLSKNSSKAHSSVLNAQQIQSSGAGVSILKSGQNQMPVMMVPVVSSNAGNAHTTLNLTSSIAGPTTMTRISENGGKDKSGSRSHRPILPKPTIVLPPSSTSMSSNNGQNPVIGEGRQGPILDVRSIIADYRSKHPGDVPRRGRRLKSALSPNSPQVAENLVSSSRVTGSGGILSMASVALGSGSQMRPGLVAPSPADIPDLGFLLSNADANRHESSRPSSADSSRGGAPAAQLAAEGGNVGGISFKDVLVQFAKLSQNEQRHEPQVPTTSSAATNAPSKPSPYPEVTLHPVLTQHSPPHQSPSTSLLHGILTKSTSMQQQRAESSSRVTNFSPTLARLLTAPERVPGHVPNTTVTPFHGSGGPVSISDLLSTNKTRNEITITPVGSQQSMKTKEEVVLLEEEQEDSADRLVIDESVDGDSRRDCDDEQGSAQDISPDEVPECQGCHQRPAQFVCAGCGNQWYCSRDCQVSAWDEHSEVCSG